MREIRRDNLQWPVGTQAEEDTGGEQDFRLADLALDHLIRLKCGRSHRMGRQWTSRQRDAPF